MSIYIKKRDGQDQKYDSNKIALAISKAFTSDHELITEDILNNLVKSVENDVLSLDREVSVEEIQDVVEKTLMANGFYNTAKSYILYRNVRTKKREVRNKITKYFPNHENLDKLLMDVQKDYDEEQYNLELLLFKFESQHKENVQDNERFRILTRAAVELTSQEAPKWEFISGRLLNFKFLNNLKKQEEELGIFCFYDKVKYLTQENLYGEFILNSYTKEELFEAEAFIDNTRNKLLNYSGLDMLINRYVITDRKRNPLESIQEMFLGVALHLAINEKNNRMQWVYRFYDMLSSLKVTVATPTLSNARKPFNQLSSCFIDTVPDNLDGIYRSLDNFAKVSKMGGGMGLYFGKVRANGSAIKGFKGAAGGIIRWIKLANDTAVAVDQLGMRKGAVAVYLDIWHKDILDFLNLRTNNGDDRMKAHDVFPAVCYPDYFWNQVKYNIEGDWFLMCPHDVKTIKGYSLEDYFGEEWKEKYLDCVNDPRIEKKVVPIKSLVRLIIKSSVETGTPFTFNRDIVNKYNPNPHKGHIYCSNLCTEIAQNMQAIEAVSQEIVDENGDTIVVTKTRPGEFVVCNLASLSLGNIDVNNKEELEYIITSVCRSLDNVIDINLFPVPYAKINNQKYRPIGLGVSGYHHVLAKNNISWESEKHLEFCDELFEDINYFALKASLVNAKEKGQYEYFKGSDFDNGDYFTKRNYNSDRWLDLKAQIKQHGIRNGYLLAIAPTGSTSIIAGTTAGIDPIMSLYFLEEKKDGLLPRVAPDLSVDTFWYYKAAHLINQEYSIKAAGKRSRHIDQAVSMNIYITNEYTFRKILNLYLLAWENEVKTVYYVRSKSLEVEECVACSS